MFGRFRKTNDPARETDGGAVAVDDPETSVATPSADPAVRERRLAELQATQADDPDTRGLDRERAVTTDRTADGERVIETDRTAGGERAAETDRAAESDRFARTEREPVAERDLDDEPMTIPAVVAEDTVVAMRARQRDRFGGIRWGSAFFGLLSAIGLAAILLGHRRRCRRGLRPVGDQRRPHGHRRHHRTRRRHPAAGDPRALLVLRRLRRRAHGALRRRAPGHRRVGVDARDRRRARRSPPSSAAAEYDVLQQLNLPNVAVGDQSLTTGGLADAGRRARGHPDLRRRRRQGRRPVPPPGRPLRDARLRRDRVGQRAVQPRSIVSGTPVMVRPPGPRR